MHRASAGLSRATIVAGRPRTAETSLLPNGRVEELDQRCGIALPLIAAVVVETAFTASTLGASAEMPPLTL
jgi:hypothetical protein